MSTRKDIQEVKDGFGDAAQSSGPGSPLVSPRDGEDTASIRIASPTWPKVQVEFHVPQPRVVMSREEAALKYDLPLSYFDWLDEEYGAVGVGANAATAPKAFKTVSWFRKYEERDSIRDAAPALLRIAQRLAAISEIEGESASAILDRYDELAADASDLIAKATKP